MAYELTETEKHDSIKYFKEFNGDLLQITQHVFNDVTEKGSTSRGRALRTFLADQGLSYKAKKGPNNKKYNLTAEEKVFLEKHYDEGMSKQEAAKHLWPKEAQQMVGFFQTEKYIALCRYINEHFAHLDEEKEADGKDYVPPKVINTLVKLVNKVTKNNLDSDKLSMSHKKCIEKLSSFLNSPRFLQQINSYTSQENRLLFEHEFVKTTWNKPDLTADEVNLYINICIDYINIKNIERQKNTLNQMFDEAESSSDLHMRLTEMLKVKSQEYDQCSKRIETLISKLNGDRKKRLEAKQQANASVLSLVETFQEEKERRRMIAMAELKAKKVKDETERLENMEEWKARVLGIGKEDII